MFARWFLAAMAVAAVAAAPAVHADETPPTTIDTAPFDVEFGRGYYLIHLLGTSTINGFVEKDVYILNPDPPVDGWFLTADGEGGTFNNKGDSLGGPFRTPRAVCGAAKGLSQQTFGVEDRYWDCQQIATGGNGGGIGLAGVVGALAAGAAVVVGIPLTWNRIRNRERPGWARTDPGTGLTNECFQALSGLRRSVDEVLGRLSDLQLAADGAGRRAAAASVEGALLDALIASQQQPAAAISGVAATASGAVNTTTDVAGIATSIAEGSGAAPGWVAAAQSQIAAADDLATAVARVRAMLMADLAGRGSSLIDARTLASCATKADELRVAGNAAMNTAAAASSRIVLAGRAFGVVSVLAGAVAMRFGSQQFDDLQLLGQWKMERELKQYEVDRWLALAGDLRQRITDLRGPFDASIAAYNARAAICSAAPLSPPPWPDVVQAFDTPPLATGAQAPPNTAIANVFPQGPDPQPRDERCVDCDRAEYDRLIAAFEDHVRRRAEAVAECRRWDQRVADVDATSAAMRDTRDAAQAYFDERVASWERWGAAGTAASVVAFTAGPLGAIALGFSSIVSGVVAGAAAPSDAAVMDVGRLDRLCIEIERTRGAIGREATRHLDEVSSYSSNLADRRRQLVAMHARCSAAAAVPWPSPPTVPDEPRWERPGPGTVRPYWEILRWH